MKKLFITLALITSTIGFAYNEADFKIIRLDVDDTADIQILKDENKDIKRAILEISKYVKTVENKVDNLENQRNVSVNKEDILVVTGYLSGRYLLNEIQKMDILNNLSKMKNKQHIEIIGYTDRKGTHKANLTLALNRAKEVAKILSDSGIKVDSIKSLGDNVIFSENESLNRRVEIIIK